MGIAEKKIAKCYILHDLDENNRCELSDRKVTVVWKGKIKEFAIEDVISVEINQRKLLIPIIFSGVLTPLILVGFFKEILPPLVGLLFIIGGIFSFYIGWSGEKVLTINQINGHRDFSMRVFTDHLIGFINYVNQYLSDEPLHERVLYLEVNKLDSERDLKVYLAKDAVDRKLYSYWEVREQYLSGGISQGKDFIVIDPIKTGSEVKYEKDPETQELTPVIKGSISQKAVIKILEFDKIASIIE